MAGVGVEGGLHGNTHHDENRLLGRKLHLTNRKKLAHDTLVSTGGKRKGHA